MQAKAAMQVKVAMPAGARGVLCARHPSRLHNPQQGGDAPQKEACEPSGAPDLTGDNGFLPQHYDRSWYFLKEIRGFYWDQE